MNATLDAMTDADSMPEPVEVMGVPLTPLTMKQTLTAIGRLIEEGRPRFLVSANLNYAMLTDTDPELREVNARAAMVLADGMPLVWASKLRGGPVRERVAGSDLLFELAAEAARQGWRVFLMGGQPGIAARAGEALTERFPGLQIVGVEVPPFRPMTEEELDGLASRVRAAQPDLLIAAFSQPRGEKWIDANCERLGVPVAIQMGAALDFAAGNVRRAPHWVKVTGLEWAFRLWVEPRRLAGRYYRNFCFLARWLLSQTRTQRPRLQPTA